MNYNVLFSFLQKSRIDFHLKSFFWNKSVNYQYHIIYGVSIFFISISVFGQFLCKKKISYQIVLIINALEIFPILFIEIHRFNFFSKKC